MRPFWHGTLIANCLILNSLLLEKKKKMSFPHFQGYAGTLRHFHYLPDFNLARRVPSGGPPDYLTIVFLFTRKIKNYHILLLNRAIQLKTT